LNSSLDKINTFIQSNNNLSSIIDYCREYKSKNEIKIYLVGGIIRDIILDSKYSFFDLDLIIDGNIDHFAKNFSEDLNCRINKIHNFPNYKLFFNDDLEIDIAHARSEQYKSPGSLPVWKKSTINDDLFRRDFSINSVAVEIHSDFLKIIDPINGIEDIENEIIKVLHNNSFSDDPTRIYRAIRYRSRLQFDFDKNTKLLFYDSIKDLNNLSIFRKNKEILKFLEEENIENFLSIKGKDSIVDSLFPKNFLNKLSFVDKNFWKKSNIKEKIFFAFFSVENQTRNDFLNSMNFSKNDMKEISLFFEIKEIVENNNLQNPEDLSLDKDFISNLYHCL
tara:strand:- start:19536 stop:20540 length:1005 start_codon:yes stop_codon:yes gene_type:complete